MRNSDIHVGIINNGLSELSPITPKSIILILKINWYFEKCIRIWNILNNFVIIVYLATYHLKL